MWETVGGEEGRRKGYLREGDVEELCAAGSIDALDARTWAGVGACSPAEAALLYLVDASRPCGNSFIVASHPLVPKRALALLPPCPAPRTLHSALTLPFDLQPCMSRESNIVHTLNHSSVVLNR